jgi:hypothetical protein
VIFCNNLKCSDPKLLSSSYKKITVNINETDCNIYEVLMMVYNTQNYFVSGLCPSSRIPNTRKHNVSETGPVSETSCSLVFGILDDRQSPETQQL